MKPRDIRKLTFGLVLVTVIFGLTGMVLAQSGEPQTRDQIDDKYKWDLADIYPDWDAWQADMENAELINIF